MRHLFWILSLFLYACSPGANKANMQGTAPCASPSCAAIEKPNPKDLLYKLSCEVEKPLAHFFAGTGTSRLENNTFASIGLFLLGSNEFELSYLESDESLLGKNLYLKSDAKSQLQFSISETSLLVLSEKSLAATEPKMIAQGQISKAGANYTVTLKFNKDLSSKGLFKQDIKLNLSAKPYGLGLAPVNELCQPTEL